MQIFDKTIADLLREKLLELEKEFKADVIFYYGVLDTAYIKPYRDFIEDLKTDGEKRNRLVIFLNTPGGNAQAVERMVEINRYHYEEVYFIVPDYAMSAGTIWCMSGDKIYMDYASALGPIDPQVSTSNGYVPALGYLDKVNEMILKSNSSSLSQAEMLMLQSVDLAMLRSYEQAKELTVSLLKEWLVKYKFKNWTLHRTSNPGSAVTEDEKQQRAEEIARLLGDNKIWHSHGRFIGINTLQTILRLEIDDYSKDQNLYSPIRVYNDMICQYIARLNFQLFLHSRKHF
jgi:hypothetical protein